MSMYIYFAFIVFLIFVIGILWNTLDYGYKVNDDSTDSLLNVTDDPIAQNSAQTKSVLTLVWNYSPLFFLICVIIWMITTAQRRDDEFG